MDFILYSRPTSVTGRQLRDVLGIRGGTSVPEGNRPTHLIRWGSSSRVPLRPRNPPINGLGAVSRASDKLGSIEHFLERNIPCPPIITTEQARYSLDFPILGRRVNHTQGNDIILCLQRSDVMRALELPDDTRPQFFTRYIPTSREFRVHVFDGEVIKISEKVLTEPDQLRSSWIRNVDNGYTFRNLRRIEQETQRSIEQISIRATQSLGLDFGAVDVILSDRGEGYVLEVNTGPSLSDNSLEIYARKFAEILGVEDINLPDQELEDFEEEELEELAY
jgi:glutathione synthase/RimK-type ligase-like ATP-grasp enzyme